MSPVELPLLTLSTARDVVVIVFCVTATTATLVFLVMAFLLYKKVIGILDSVHSTIKGVENIVGPILRAVGLLASAWKILQGVFGDGKKERRDTA